MDSLVALLNVDDTGTEDTTSTQQTGTQKKKKGTGNLSKKNQARLAEEQRQQAAKQKQELLRDTKKRIQQEWEENQAKAQIYKQEFASRYMKLDNTFKTISEIEEAWKERQKELKNKEKWNFYVKGGLITDLTSLSQINTYLYIWKEIDKNEQISHSLAKAEEMIQLLEQLENLLDDPEQELTPNALQDLKNLRKEMRKLLQDRIDQTTYNIFSRIDTNMTPLNVTNAKFFAQNQFFIMNLWGELITPISSSKGRETRLPIRVFFEESHLMIVIPVCFTDVQKVIRAMWLSYDHWSDLCRTYSCPNLPEHFKQNLLELFQSQFVMKDQIMGYREELEKKIKKNITKITPDMTVSQELLIWEGKPQKVLSEEIAHLEWEEERIIGNKLKDVVDEFEINLRERTILGQILLLEILHEPPQSICLRYKHCVTLRQKPPVLQIIDFNRKCRHIKNEESEEDSKGYYEDLKRDGFSEIFNPKELIEVQLKLSEMVLWFEQPAVANWIPSRQYWSCEDIHDLYLDEKEGTLSFTTGHLGLIGLHVRRYCLLPYEDWIFEGNEENGVDFYLKTSKAELIFKIREGEVCLHSLNNAPSKAMDWILDRYYDPHTLMKILRKGGIDIFPAPDAFSYLEDITPKHIVIEKHIYQVWGIFSKSFRFKFSKFNQEVGRQSIVFQAQEVYPNHQLNYCLIQNSICSSFVLDIDESSEKYESTPVPSMDIYIDLYNLLLHNCTGTAKRLIDITNFVMIQTVQEFLALIRPLSFSYFANQ